MKKTTCVNYGGGGMCKFPQNKKCAYHLYDGSCKVGGDLDGSVRAKTRYESKNAEGQGFSQLMNGMTRL